MAENKLLDASVIIAAYPENNKAAQALISSRGKNYLIDLALIEVANVVRFSTKSQIIVSQLLKKLSHKRFSLIEFNNNDLDIATDIALQTSTTVYDALYHAVAIRQGAVFYTLDAKYYAKAKDLGNIVLLKD